MDENFGFGEWQRIAKDHWIRVINKDIHLSVKIENENGYSYGVAYGNGYQGKGHVGTFESAARNAWILLGEIVES